MRLSARALGHLPAEVVRPTWDRSSTRVGVVHVGLGGFARAHLAVYLDRLLAGNDSREQGQDAQQWGICGVGLLPADERMREVLRAQDHLYTVLTKAPDGDLEARVVGSVVDYLFAPDDPDAVVERMADPDVRIVSLTVTEGGYGLDPVTGEFDADTPGVRDDLQPGATPRTVFGLVTEALLRRRDRGIEPFTVLSCDNLPGNGTIARRSFGAFARLRDEAAGQWLDSAVRFPNSMVDRITPGTTDDDRSLLRDRFGIEDDWPVVCEPFSQWVIEDAFGDGRPSVEEVGAQVVDDVGPYELMKLRLLNAGHQTLGYLGLLAGYRTVDEAADDADLARLLEQYLELEATPTLDPVPGVDLADYRRTLLERFRNPGVRDTLARLCVDSSERMPKFVLPVVAARLEAGTDLRRAALVVAAWARWAEGVDEQGGELTMTDPRADALRAAAARQREDPLAFVANRELFGDLADDPRFTEPYMEALRSLHDDGVRTTLKRFTAPS